MCGVYMCSVCVVCVFVWTDVEEHFRVKYFGRDPTKELVWGREE